MRRGRGSPLAEASSRLLRCLGLFACGIILAGCAPERASHSDPLLGGVPLPRNGPAAAPAATAAVVPPAPLVGPPPLPPSSAALSPAALAAGPAAPDDNPLRIGPPPPSPVSGPPQPSVLTSAPHEGADPWQSAPAAGGATLKGPETISDAPARPIAMIAPPTLGGAGTPGTAPPTAARDSYADLQDKLSQRKVVFQSLEGPDEKDIWRFSCGVPSRDQAGAVHRIELSAAGDRGLNAIRAVIDQIDNYQR
jgi:hypothetical protein